jgi:hypothetical protein
MSFRYGNDEESFRYGKSEESNNGVGERGRWKPMGTGLAEVPLFSSCLPLVQ